MIALKTAAKPLKRKKIITQTRMQHIQHFCISDANVIC
jgi:hypothetical protein